MIDRDASLFSKKDENHFVLFGPREYLVTFIELLRFERTYEQALIVLKAQLLKISSNNLFSFFERFSLWAIIRCPKTRPVWLVHFLTF